MRAVLEVLRRRSRSSKLSLFLFVCEGMHTVMGIVIAGRLVVHLEKVGYGLF